MKKYRQNFIVIVLVVIVFPVLTTFIAGRINVNKKVKNALSEKIIVVDYGKYIAEMNIEDFISCVLMAQMSIESPKELLKVLRA